ncbi:MAG: 4-(cytidine 5'-diphospho)-2-C-methyl-D-erythritol kinase [Thomasclavelia sp.]|uniref:4-(cytidine 5'-diphospho)-2-C-methyl-D-erythritol kinase n=1 Tax=Thomasclavelia sp. TaxID=3025757 RepID=UPI0039A243B5
MKIKAYAKINLALDVIRKREDGYHELEMIMAPITLHDLIYINTIDEGIEIESNSKIMPTDERNIMYKAVALIKERYGIKKGVKIYVYKHIPTQAGLAGGSADGAAVIKAMNKLFYLNLSNEQMARLGKEVGADVPFCIYQKMAIVSGIGEKLTFIEQPFECKILLVKPKKGVSTKKSFSSLDLSRASHQDCYLMAKGIEQNDYQTVIDNLQNTLEAPSIKMVPEIAIIKQEMLKIGFDGALMSGSGSCVFGLTRSDMILEKGFKFFKGKYYFVRKTEILNEEEIV